LPQEKTIVRAAALLIAVWNCALQSENWTVGGGSGLDKSGLAVPDAAVELADVVVGGRCCCLEVQAVVTSSAMTASVMAQRRLAVVGGTSRGYR